MPERPFDATIAARKAYSKCGAARDQRALRGWGRRGTTRKAKWSPAGQRNCETMAVDGIATSGTILQALARPTINLGFRRLCTQRTLPSSIASKQETGIVLEYNVSDMYGLCAWHVSIAWLALVSLVCSTIFFSGLSKRRTAIAHEPLPVPRALESIREGFEWLQATRRRQNNLTPVAATKMADFTERFCICGQIKFSSSVN